MRSREFSHAAKNSDNYCVLVAREALPQLPYSVEGIYELRNTGRSSSKYPAYSRTYTSTQKVYGVQSFDGSRPDLVVVEDSNSGFDFFLFPLREERNSLRERKGQDQHLSNGSRQPG